MTSRAFMFRERVLTAVLGRARFLSPRIASSVWFWHRLGYWPKLNPPKTFNEKILFRKLYDRNELFGVLCDKLAVREFVRDRVGDEYLPIVFQVVSDPADFDLDALPESFALKANHGWAQHILVPRKSEFSLDDHSAGMRQWLIRHHGQKRWALEWAYSQVEPKLYAEEFLHGEGGGPPPGTTSSTYTAVGWCTSMWTSTGSDASGVASTIGIGNRWRFAEKCN